MLDYRTMIDDLQLDKIEIEINKQVDSVKNHPDRLKAAIMLAMLSESCFHALSGINTQNFVKALNERLSAIHNEYDEKLFVVVSKLKEDSAILNKMERVESGLEDKKHKAVAAVELFEAELKELVQANDNKPICTK